MFLEKLKSNNSALLEFAFEAQQKGLILPDTYILDLDTIIDNGRKMIAEAKKYNIKMYFMLKQIGRNPLVAKELMNIGFDGCVAVDYKEALTMIASGIHISNVGHLVQVPDAALKKIIASKPDLITVYSIEKIRKINEIAKEMNVVQPLLMKITDEDSSLYSGQVGGFKSCQLKDVVKEIEELKNVAVGGLTVFPALLYNEKSNSIEPTTNMMVMTRAMGIMKDLEFNDLIINIPSATCCASIKQIADLGGNSGEPGHGLTGTTPLHRYTNQPERVGYVYVSEISHNYNDKSYCYGGGNYRRGHMENVLVGDSLENSDASKVKAPNMDSIDYHYEIEGNFTPGLAAVMCYRTQIFTTRSHVAVVRGLKEGAGEIIGLFDSQGNKLEINWRYDER